MASAIATTKAEPRPRGLFRSRIARFIALGNLLGLGILTIGVLVLSGARAQLIRAQIDNLTTQGELIANVLAETATQGEPEPALLEQRARQVLQRLMVPPASRVRVFAPDGRLVADTNVLADRVTERRLPAPRAGREAEEENRLGLRLAPWRPHASLEEERAAAAAGQRSAGQRQDAGGERVISVSMPVQRVQAVVAVLTIESGDVDAILAAERRATWPFILSAATVTFLSSGLLALFIARPLRRLADAADSLRRSGATRLVLPEVSRRKDEIGDLAKAIERMTAALAERIDANERFAADVAHEIKNPLTSIRSAVETARALKRPEDRERMLSIIAADVNRLDRLITDISRATRLEAETARGAADRVDLGKLLSDITDTYAGLRKKGEAAVTFRGPAPADAIVLGLDGALGQVFRNLIDNAKSFSPPGGVVTVGVERVRRRDGAVVVATISDQGPGVAPENLEAIFERFYTDRPKGAAFGANSGLGLSIARQIVEAHKGRIWAENIEGARPDERLGARLIVELPAAA